MRVSVNIVQDQLSHTLSSWLQRSWYAFPPLAPPWPLRCLLVLGTVFYGVGLQRDQLRALEYRRELPAPVISVGNLVVGGTGKTPMCWWLARFFHGLGWKPAILSRGYGRQHGGTARVPSTGETSLAALSFGDEPVLLAHQAQPVPVWVGKDRWCAGTLAIARDGANVLILDDGFQHLSLKRNLDLVLLDARIPLGNGAILPLGPLREPPEHLERADAIVLTRADISEATAQTRAMITGRFPGKPVFACTHRLIGLRVGLNGQVFPPEALQGEKAVAFAGIARPETFFSLLEQAGIVIGRKFSFPDHHRYQESDLRMLLKARDETETRFLITTEKDLVRLPPELQTVTLATSLDLDFGSEHQAFTAFLLTRVHGP